MRSWLLLVLLVAACSGKKTEPPHSSGSGSGPSTGSAAITQDAPPPDVSPDAPTLDASAPAAATDFVPAPEAPRCSAASQRLVEECLESAFGGALGDAEATRLADLALVRIIANSSAHVLVVARAGDRWRAVSHVFTETITDTMTVTKFARVSSATRIDLKIELIKQMGEDTDAHTTQTASIICPRGADGAITACSKPYVLVCDSKGYSSYKSRAKLALRPDGTLSYMITENAMKFSPCALP